MAATRSDGTADGCVAPAAPSSGETPARELRLGGIDVRIEGRRLRVGGADVAALSDREGALLDELLARPGVVHSKRELLRTVWGSGETDEHVVEVTIARLRRRLGPAAVGIETVLRRGYRATGS